MLVTEEEARTKWCPHVRLRNLAAEDQDVRDAPMVLPEKDDDYQLVVSAPFAAAAYNRLYIDKDDLGKSEEGCRCIASQCMAWRAIGRYGFCGLAGKVDP
jgi:hypothetical protein